ncbi:glucoamylase family protein [Joostella sp.]|uniref:glucoamylase family protein n=1 Tax=Joostella sp. TaxID=2231138 RepID=UPI003A8D7C66
MRLILAFLAVTFTLVGCDSSKKTDKKEASEVTNTETSTFTPSASDKELMDKIQKQTFEYFWDGAQPNSGLAAERIHLDDIYPSNDKHIVTTGGSGFGVMAILVGVERGYITKQQALTRYIKIVDFLKKADRFHGAWPHWMDDNTGKVKPFSKYDDGGDLVETAFLIQGLLTVAEYYKTDSTEESKQLVADIQELYEDVEWDWYTKGEDVLYWHWSPNNGWKMNFAVSGYNECLIMYILAAASPTHPISKEVYEKGWAKSGAIATDATYYDLKTVLKHNSDTVGPLFWAHYSYLGLNPKGLKDQYGDYWELNKNHALINYKYCVDNPQGYKGYGENCWGLTASYSVNGYAGHHPGKSDLGVISPTAALSSMPYTPKESMQFLRFMYKEQDSLIGKYGPYDAFSIEEDWFVPRYLAIDQGPIPVMIENYRTGLFWKLFMKNGDVQNGLNKLGFTYEK